MRTPSPATEGFAAALGPPPGQAHADAQAGARPLPQAASDALQSQARLVRLLTACAVLLLLTAVGGALWWDRYKELDTAARSGEREVNRMGDELGRSLELAKVVIAQHEARLRRAPEGSSAAAVLGAAAAEHDRLAARLPFPFGVWALDARGEVLGPEPAWRQPAAGLQGSLQPLPELPDGDNWAIASTQGRPGARAVPLLRRAAPNPQGVAAFVVALDHAALVRRLERDRMPKTGGAGLFRLQADGGVQVLARAPHAEAELGRTLSGPLAQALARAGSGTFEAVTEIDGTWRVAAYQRLGGDASGLVLTYGVSKGTILADWNRGLPIAALITAVLAAGMLWGGWRLTQSLRLLGREREALVRSENQFRALADNLPDLVTRLDDAGRYLYANPAVQQAMGQPFAALIGKTNAELGVPRDLVALWQTVLDRAFASGRTERIEFASDGPQGPREWESLVTREPLQPGQPLSVLIISRDVTTRKRTEDALREREERLRKSEMRYRVATTGTPVWEWDFGKGEGLALDTEFWSRIGQPNPSAQNIVPLFQQTLHPDDLQHLRKVLKAHLRHRTPYQLEFRARHANGEWLWFYTQGQAVWGDDGTSSYMAGTTFDITARKQAEEALQATQAYQRRVFEQLAEGVVLIGTGYHILDANPRAAAMVGYTHDELLRLSVNDVLAASERPRIEVAMEVVAQRNPDSASWSIRRKDGSCFTAEVSARPLGDGRYVLVVRDVTQQRRAEQALLNSQAELSELTRRLLMQEQMTTRRIAQSLHDHLGQTLAAARLNLEACVSSHSAAMPPALVAQSQRIGALLDKAVHEVRQVLSDLRPPFLEDMGLAAALDNEIGTCPPLPGQADVLLEVGEGGFQTRWPAEVTYAAFMVAREAVANAHQHAQASLIRVTLEGSGTTLQLHIIDNGCGLPAGLVNGRPGHLGMVGMRERALAINACFTVEAVPSGGTSIALLWQAEPS